MPIAGGTDLVVGGRQGKKPLPDSLVGIHRLPGLGSIEETTDGLNLGALVTHAAIAAERSDPRPLHAASPTPRPSWGPMPPGPTGLSEAT